MQTVTIDTSSATTLTQQAQAALTSAGDIIIDSQSMYEIAGAELQGIKTLQKQTEEQRVSITGPLNAALKAVNDLFRAPKDFLDQAEKSVKRSMITYQTEQERIAAEARRKAEAEARVAREQLAQKQREQEEAARKATAASEQAQRDAQSAIAAGNVAAAEAAQQEANLQAEAADALEAEAEATAITAEVMTFTPARVEASKVSGISGRVTYVVEITDVKALIQAVAAGTVPIEAVTPDLKFIGAQARAFKKVGPLYPGVVVVAERGISARAA